MITVRIDEAQEACSWDSSPLGLRTAEQGHIRLSAYALSSPLLLTMPYLKGDSEYLEDMTRVSRIDAPLLDSVKITFFNYCSTPHRPAASSDVAAPSSSLSVFLHFWCRDHTPSGTRNTPDREMIMLAESHAIRPSGKLSALAQVCNPVILPTHTGTYRRLRVSRWLGEIAMAG